LWRALDLRWTVDVWSLQKYSLLTKQKMLLERVRKKLQLCGLATQKWMWIKQS
jgi:hypothetical protein